MKSLSSRLNCRVKVYKNSEDTSKWSASIGKRIYFKSVWAEIKPVGGSDENSAGNVEVQNVEYLFTIRENALSEITTDMAFEYKDAFYEVKYSRPNFKYKDSVEVFCVLEKG